jgi:hypothetical protein
MDDFVFSNTPNCNIIYNSHPKFPHFQCFEDSMYFSITFIIFDMMHKKLNEYLTEEFTKVGNKPNLIFIENNILIY